MSVLRIAGLQTPGTPGDVEANLDELNDAARDAAGAGAGLLISPEMFITGYDIGDGIRQPVPVERITAIAKSHRIAVLTGMPAPREHGVANSAVFIRPDGSVAVRYDKTHLFSGLDKDRFVAGDSLAQLVEYNGVNIGILICYDVEFPEAVRQLVAAGADLIAVPTANMRPFEFICRTIIPARAWENQVYIAYINHSGVEGQTVYAGESSVVAPDGGRLAVADGGRELLVADIDGKVVERGRKSNPYLIDRRPELYR